MFSAVVKNKCVIPQDTKSLFYSASQPLKRKRCPVVTLQDRLRCHEHAAWNCCVSLGEPMFYVAL